MYKIIEQLCAERGIKPGKMCEDLGMSRSFMTELRKGRAKSIKVETAKKIADYFGVSTDYLLNGTDDSSMGEPKKETECPIRHTNDLCLACGNNCKEVKSEICKALQIAYQIGYEESVSDVTTDILHALNKTMENRIKKG